MNFMNFMNFISLEIVNRTFENTQRTRRTSKPSVSKMRTLVHFKFYSQEKNELRRTTRLSIKLSAIELFIRLHNAWANILNSTFSKISELR